MFHQETTLFECPCIGDDLNERDDGGEFVWSLERLHAIIDRCSNPPQFRGVKTPITELLEQDGTKATPKSNSTSQPEKKNLNSRATEKPDARQPTSA
jgi:hypothetical protein